MEEHATKSAIVGMGFEGPGAQNVDEFWKLLENGENHITDIPTDRWNNTAFYSPDPDKPGKSYVTKAGFVSRPFDFDNKFFNINDTEARSMDPQQRFALRCAYMAMEDAGLTREMLAKSRTGVYMGSMNQDFSGMYAGPSPAINNYTVTGVSNTIIASRIAFFFDLRGPAMVIDTGCSSALVAIHQAILGLRNGKLGRSFRLLF
ncbi:putative uncharacterized protein encoded by LINC00614 [Physella acuta]|uniref:putative uncharacterized protein encoded by LINC00614 n=1 Tax=Physella acuta TaxID=109671 RepID=UPI0027DDB5FC|nr:putative uncharacterized protein encoded by LINC00614 [Physella acuta]